MKEIEQTDYKAGRRGLLFFLLLTMGLLGQLYMESHFHIFDGTLRFHVRAASDAAWEQQCKRKVRDAVLASIREEADQATDARELERRLQEKKREIQEVAQQTLAQLGSRETVKVAFVEERFPLRQYGGVFFPAGRYRALRVDIGVARGHNWWCAIYPELCYNESDTFLLSGKGRSDLNRILSRLEKRVLTGKVARWLTRLGESVEEMRNGE